MSICRNEIPILEYGSDTSAVIMPDHEHIDMKLSKKAVFAFLGDTVDRYAREYGAEVASCFISATKHYPVYIIGSGQSSYCLVQAPVGATAATHSCLPFQNSSAIRVQKPLSVS